MLVRKFAGTAVPWRYVRLPEMPCAMAAVWCGAPDPAAQARRSLPSAIIVTVPVPGFSEILSNNILSLMVSSLGRACFYFHSACSSAVPAKVNRVGLIPSHVGLRHLSLISIRKINYFVSKQKYEFVFTMQNILCFFYFTKRIILCNEGFAK